MHGPRATVSRGDEGGPFLSTPWPVQCAPRCSGDGTAEGGVDAGLVYSRSMGTDRDRDEGYMERKHK